MTNHRLMTLLALGLIGYGGLFFLFRKTHPAARWNFEIDRAAVIEKVKAAASSYGYASPAQSITINVKYSRDDEYYLSSQAGALFTSLFTPLKAEVNLYGAKPGSSFEARLN